MLSPSTIGFCPFSMHSHGRWCDDRKSNVSPLHISDVESDTIGELNRFPYLDLKP
jgi:hypothetical protein